MPSTRYRQLDPERLIETVRALQLRVRERFPTANLLNVTQDLLEVAEDAARRSAAIRRRSIGLRAFSLVLVIATIGALSAAIASVHPHFEDGWRWTEVIQSLEALLGSLFFLGAGVLSVVTLETRSKRRRCLHAIHELRAMAHIVDMHQLTKDPERLDAPEQDTPSSPKRPMSAFELSRYLDYCSEMLSLMGKVAALYVQGFADAQAVSAVDEIETLTTSLSRKIWQKIMILQAKS